MTVTKSDFSTLEQLARWLNLNKNEQDGIIRGLEEEFQGEYIHQYTLSYSDKPSLRIPSFRHQPTGIEFNLIVGGQFQMGLSVQEEEVVRRLCDGRNCFLESFDFMRPVRTVHVKPFLLSKFPILNTFVRKHLELEIDDFVSDFAETNYEIVPASLTREQIDVLMERFGFRLPSEAQWEYAYRGGTTTIFYWGNELPNPEVLEKKILLYEFSNPQLCREAANPFGLVGLSVGEWCEDSFRPDYNDALETDLPVMGTSPYVARGGGAIAWPWQESDEWIMCLSAMRQQSNFEYPLAGRFMKALNLKH
jgi:formylglycine-generating enzyme